MTLHDLLRLIVHALKALDERTKGTLLAAIAEHEDAHAAVPAADAAPVADATPTPDAAPDTAALLAAIAALSAQLAARTVPAAAPEVPVGTAS